MLQMVIVVSIITDNLAHVSLKSNHDFARVRVHDLKHMFGRRLRAAGVSFEDRQVLLGYKNRSVTTHYSAPDIANLVEAANRVAATERRKIDAMTILRRKTG